MDADHMMLLIEFDVHGEIEGHTPEIMHPESLLSLIVDLPSQALISNDMEIIEVHNNRCNDFLILVMKHQQSSFDM
jgi:hypothetical protein